MSLGKRIHIFLPVTTAFQAEVAFGSQWKVEPDRSGPAICGGLLSALVSLKGDCLATHQPAVVWPLITKHLEQIIAEKGRDLEVRAESVPFFSIPPGCLLDEIGIEDVEGRLVIGTGVVIGCIVPHAR